MDAADWDRATDAVRAGWYALVSDHADGAREIFHRVPVSVLRQYPLLAMEYGILLNQLRFQRLRPLRYFAMAVRAARSKRNHDLRAVDRLLIRSSESAGFRLLGRTDMSVSAARASMELAEALTDEERASLTELPRLYAVLGMSFYYGGHHAEALRAASLGLAEASLVPPSNGMGPLALLAGIHALRGDLANAREHIEYGRSDLWTDRQRDGYSGIFYRIAESVLALEAFSPEDARARLDSLYAMTRGRRTTEHWSLLAEIDALIELVGGHPGRGLARLEEAIELRGGEGGTKRARARLARIRSLLHLALRNPDGASAVLARDLPSGHVARIERARVALSLGQTGTALNELRAVSGAHLSTRQTAEVAALDAAVLLRVSMTPRREAAVQRLGSLLDRSGLRLPLFLLPAPDVARVAGALDEAGFAHVTAGLPPQPLLGDVEPQDLLTKRELAVLEQLMHTPSIARIAEANVVSTNTVKSQLRSIYRKLGVSSREDAIAVAMERHLFAEAD